MAEAPVMCALLLAAICWQQQPGPLEMAQGLQGELHVGSNKA